jgi:uncharacterized protein (DUF488 family)
MESMTTTLHTLGHANRSFDELASMLQLAGVMTLVDVRQHPQSARHPHFAQESLRVALEGVGIQYHWAGRQLGGHRQPRATSRHTALTDAGLRGFADYMDGDAFKKGVAQLLNLANRESTAMLCAEGDPLHCHRSLIADYLTLQGIEVIHLIAPGQTRPHSLRAEVRRESQQLVYDRSATVDLASYVERITP